MVCVFLFFQGTKGLTMFFMRTRNEDGTLNKIEIQVMFRLNRPFHGFFLNFDLDKLGKIRQLRWKERL